MGLVLRLPFPTCHEDRIDPSGLVDDDLLAPTGPVCASLVRPGQARRGGCGGPGDLRQRYVSSRSKAAHTAHYGTWPACTGLPGGLVDRARLCMRAL